MDSDSVPADMEDSRWLEKILAIWQLHKACRHLYSDRICAPWILVWENSGCSCQLSPCWKFFSNSGWSSLCENVRQVAWVIGVCQVFYLQLTVVNLHCNGQCAWCGQFCDCPLFGCVTLWHSSLSIVINSNNICPFIHKLTKCIVNTWNST